MEEFLGWARKTIQDQFDFLSDCKRRFAALVDYYCYRGNGGNGGVVSPSEFFELWTEMCSDFVESRTANGCQENLREEERNVEEIEEE